MKHSLNISSWVGLGWCVLLQTGNTAFSLYAVYHLTSTQWICGRPLPKVWYARAMMMNFYNPLSTIYQVLKACKNYHQFVQEIGHTDMCVVTDTLGLPLPPYIPLSVFSFHVNISSWKRLKMLCVRKVHESIGRRWNWWSHRQRIHPRPAQSSAHRLCKG